MTLLPVNTKWPWITAAQFRPELVPEELMAQGLTVRDPLHFTIIIFSEIIYAPTFFCFSAHG